MAALVDGKASGIREGMKVLAEGLDHRITSAEKQIKGWAKTIAAEKKKDAAHRAWRKKCKLAADAGKKRPAMPKSLARFEVGPSARLRIALRRKTHHKKRYLASLETELAALWSDIESGRIRLCFGSRKLFKAQHNLAANGFSSHEEWRDAWIRSRTSEIFCIGSKDEERGSQTASWLGDGRLRLRVPPALEGKYGKHLVLQLKEFRREGVQDRVDAIADEAAKRDKDGKLATDGQGLSWRLVRRDGKYGDAWVAQVTYETVKVERITDKRLGAWGLDFNPDHIAMTRVDRFGNIVETKTRKLDLQDETADQIAAILGDAAAWAVVLCVARGVPLHAEELDFRAKKATLRERGRGYARMLSQFAYKTFQTLTDRRAEACGVELRRDNAAFTSVIGDAKFGLGYNLSVHHAAGCAIARRGLRFSERLARRVTGPLEAGETLPSRNAFPLPARTRGKHVWSDWRKFSNMLRTARLRARTAVDEAGGVKPDPRGYGSGKARRGAPRVTTAMQGQTCRKPAKLFCWRSFRVHHANDRTDMIQ